MELINKYPAKEGEIMREDRAIGHYSESFKLYFLKKIELFQYPDGQTKVRFENKESNHHVFSVLPYDDFLNDKKGTKDRIFTKEELLNDFFEKIKENGDMDEQKMRFLSKSAFEVFGRKEMSQFFVDNLEKHKEDWPKTMIILEEPNVVDRNFEVPGIVRVKTEEIIKGAF